jgi:hypothetical protein
MTALLKTTVQRNQCVSRILKRLKGFYGDDWTKVINDDYSMALNKELLPVVGSIQIGVINDVLDHLPILIPDPLSFCMAIRSDIKQTKAMQNESTEWAHDVIEAVRAGHHKSLLSVVSARKALGLIGNDARIK